MGTHANHICNTRAGDLSEALRMSSVARIAAIEIHTEVGDTYQAWTCPRRGLGYDLVRIERGSGRRVPIAPPMQYADCWQLDELVRFLEAVGSPAATNRG